MEVEHRNSLDEPIGYYKSWAYVKWKSKQTSISPYFDGNEVDLFLTGTFQQKIRLDVQKETHDFVDMTDYGKYLIDRYGEEIMQLSERSLKKIRKELTPILIQKIHEFISKN